MDMIGKIRRMHSRDEEVGARDRAHRRGCRATRSRSGCRATVEGRAEVPARRAPSKLTPFVEAHQAGAEGRRAPTEEGAAHGQGAAQARSVRPATTAATRG